MPPLGGHTLFLFLLQIGVLLLAALILGQLANRLGMPRIVGELLTGIVLGPSLLGNVAPTWFATLFPQQSEQMQPLDAFGQVGCVLLVGLTGLQLDLALVKRRGGTAVKISLPGLVIPLGLGIGAGSLVPASLLADSSQRAVFAGFLGVALCVSAIPVIAKTLIDLKLMHRNIGQLILVSSTVDDVLGWLGLSIVTAMATTGLRAGAVLLSISTLAAFLVVASLVGRPLVTAGLRAAERSGGTTPAVLAVVVILTTSAITQRLGLEAVFGAMVAGIVLRAADVDIQARLAPVRLVVMAILAPVFFAMTGLRMDLSALANPIVLAFFPALLAIAVVGKFAGAFLGAWTSGLNRWEGLALGAGMNSRGIVEVVVATTGLRLGVLTTETYTVIVLIAIITSVMSPPILRLAAARIAETSEEQTRLRSLDPREVDNSSSKYGKRNPATDAVSEGHPGPTHRGPERTA
ncbi:cation:proton antiporter [Nocardia sp. NPDC049190]|uniref:cation:proton antiporter n=1 Tax=Nocardia sp. NPDC049190 TaxID=3155650 RepID=UPI003410BFD6